MRPSRPRLSLVKKLLAGCLVLVVIGVVILGIAGFFGYRFLAPYVQQGRESFEQLERVPALDQALENTAAYTAPDNGELTKAQVDRFARVQAHVRASMGTRIDEMQKRYQGWDNQSAERPSAGDLLSAFSDLGGLFADARRYQVEGLNRERFSRAEYDWVRMRAYAAAGVELASGIDFRGLEKIVRSGERPEGERTGGDARVGELPRVPDQNRKLLEPYLQDVSGWIPLAFFGL